MCPLLELAQVPLHGIPSLRHVNHTTQLGVVCKLAEATLDTTVDVILNSTGPIQTPKGHHLTLISIWTLSH